MSYARNVYCGHLTPHGEQELRADLKAADQRISTLERELEQARRTICYDRCSGGRNHHCATCQHITALLGDKTI